MTTTIRTLIVDDEPLARLNLRSLLEDEPDFEVVGECATAEDAVRALGVVDADLVFLDIEMPGSSGLEVIGAAAPAHPPAVVFVTAHERFAARAFELEAVDYLLKPFRRERFRHVLGRVRKHLAGGGVEHDVAAPEGAAAIASTSAPDRMLVKSAGRWVFVAFDELQFVRAAGNYVALHVGTDPQEIHEVRDTIGAIESRLPPGRFLRLHRSYIANVAALASLEPAGGGEFIARLRGGRELPVGPTYLEGLRHALERYSGGSAARLG
jgi:two-component system LytT family response regulator